jgi:hypothetical protein
LKILKQIIAEVTSLFENQSIWESYTTFLSAKNVQKLLLSCYKQQNIEQAEKKSYENCYPFIYYLEHGHNYYQFAQHSPLSIKPVLLFYGMVQFLKACLLTVDPYYPESTSVLAHGVSTRKRKKQQYEFFYDEVKIQKFGLFTHFSEKMFHVKHLEGEKYSMGKLLKTIPELRELLYISLKKDLFAKIVLVDSKHLLFPEKLLDTFHMTSDRLIEYINGILPVEVEYVSKDQQYFRFSLLDTNELSPLNCAPLLYHLEENNYYLLTERNHLHFSEIMTHYLLLYNLSMISRYETDWWIELLHTYSSNDYPLICQFLSITSKKVPYLLFLFLQNKIKHLS